MSDSEEELDLNVEIENIIQPLPSDVVAQVQATVRKNSKFTLVPTETRNILLVDEKKIALGVLKDPTFQYSNCIIKSDMNEPSFHSMSVTKDNIPKVYTINFIDAPADGENSEQMLMNLINYTLKQEITHVHAIIIFISLKDGVTDSHKKLALSYIEQLAERIKLPVNLCVYHETLEASWQPYTRNMLMKNNDFARILSMENVTLSYFRSVDYSRANFESHSQQLFSETNSLREKMLNYIIETNSKKSLADYAQERLDTIFSNLFSILSTLESLKANYSSNNVKKNIAEFASNIDRLFYYDALLLDPTNLKKFNDMKNRVSKLALIMNSDDFHQLLGKVTSLIM